MTAAVRAERVHLPMRHFLRIAARDDWTCHVCDLGYLPRDPWEVDHVVPLARGGTNHIANLKLCHRSCNRDKAAS